MTARRRDGAEDGWRRWVRGNPRLDSVAFGLSITDIDMLIHRYRTHTDRCGSRWIQCIMAVEWKAYGAKARSAQRDTLLLTSEILRKCHGRTIYVPGRSVPKCKCFSFGVHMCRMSGRDPDQSDELWWDRRRISVDQLEALLRFELHPDDPSRAWSPRRHHTRGDSDTLRLDLDLDDVG